MMRKFLKASLFFLSAHVAFAASPDVLQNVQWNSQTHALKIGQLDLKVGYDMVCGMYDNQSEYASFGLEEQIYKCSKIVIPFSLKAGHWFGTFEFAPLYDSVEAKTPSTVIIYGKDSKGREIQGNNPYFDWYKNLGTQIYYLGKYPVVQAYVGYQFYAHNKILAGRVKNEIGLADDDTPWGSDAMFSPYAYWLSRDLLTGLVYQFSSYFLDARASVLSGNNPMKGYGDYLNYIQSPNLKANNTPTLAANISLNVGRWVQAQNHSKIMLGVSQNTAGSTWVDGLQDGKRQNSVYAAGLLLNFPWRQDVSLDVFSQYTRYLSGLTTHSGQNRQGDPLFKNITQSGYFAGLTLHYRFLSLSYTHEVFDRFDFNVYGHWLSSTDRARDFSGRTLKQVEALKQSSNIVNVKAQINRYVALLVNLQNVVNPLPWVSSILDTKPSYRLGAGISVNF